MSDTNNRVESADVLAVDARVARTLRSEGYGVTQDGFVPKPYGRALAEKLALARELLGSDLDLGAGSAIRKILEVSALEDARTWAALSGIWDDLFVSSASGEALSRLGEELGIPRPFLEARGTLTIKLSGALPTGVDSLLLQRGSRLSTPGGHQVALDDTVRISQSSPRQVVNVVAFYPGPEHDLDPAQPAQRIDRWHPLDPQLADLRAAEAAAGAALLALEHTQALTGGEQRWPDERYRQLLLAAPRSVWTVDAVRAAVSLVPGVRQVQVRDGWGGLDIHQSIFGNFNFIERVFGTDRDIGSPYYFTVLVAPTPAAIWDGEDGLRISVESAIEDIRPVGIFPRVVQAEEIAVGIAADLVVRGLPLPAGPRSVVNASPEALELKRRLLERVRRYIDGLQVGEPVRAAEVTWALMSEPGIADVRKLRLLVYPPELTSGAVSPPPPRELACGDNAELHVNQIAVLVDDGAGLVIV
jgi:hypothetical protein